MKVHAIDPSMESTNQELQRLQGYWRWFMVMGISMVVLGTFAIGWACVVTMTIAATWIFGFFLLTGGIAEIINSFSVGRWSGMLLHLIIGALYTIVGLMIIQHPESAALQLTLVIAIFLIVGGTIRVIFALSERFTGWVWVTLNGVVSFMLGMMIYKQWPASGLWVIGLFVGIDLIFNGWTWIMLASGLRAIPPKPAAIE